MHKNTTYCINWLIQKILVFKGLVFLIISITIYIIDNIYLRIYSKNIYILEDTENIMTPIAQFLFNMGISPEFLALTVFTIFIIAVWSAVWKALALWKSARKNDLVWFIVFIIVNTLGILEILYIYVFSKGRKSNQRK